MKLGARVWKVLFALFAGCAVAGVAAWGILLTSFCGNPRKPVPETQHVIAYSCHGMTVFVTPFDDALRHWLIPAAIVLSLMLCLVAAAMLVRAAVRVRVDVHIHRT